MRPVWTRRERENTGDSPDPTIPAPDEAAGKPLGERVSRERARERESARARQESERVSERARERERERVASWVVNTLFPPIFQYTPSTTQSLGPGGMVGFLFRWGGAGREFKKYATTGEQIGVFNATGTLTVPAASLFLVQLLSLCIHP